MKTVTRKISLLFMLGAVLFLGSCLDSGGFYHNGIDEYSYITKTETGKVFARTGAGHFITSEKISLLIPGTVAELTYKITEETEVIRFDENVDVYKVNLGAEPIELKQETLQSIKAPLTTDTVYFESIFLPPVWISQSSAYFGDRWPITFQYKAKKGEKVNVSFYKVQEGDIPENFDADILIDIRIEKTGVPEENAKEELKNDLIVANMSMLRETPLDENSQDTKQLNIKFRFFRNDKKGKLHIFDTPITITVLK